jgi:hypothetical protein
LLKRLSVPLTLIALVALPAQALAEDALERWRPVYRFDRSESYLPIPVEGHGKPVVYGRAAGGWLQYWTYYAYNSQDRGVLKTGRHEGDWEMVQVRPGESAVYAQHAWAERCPARAPLTVYVANGSHAAYFTRGVHDRPWPDPNDEARGDGVVVRPRLVRITRASPPWMRRPSPWGSSRAGWFPAEESSPRGPAFQPERFDRPAAWAASARECGSGAPGRPLVAYLALLPLLAAAWFVVARMRRRVSP